MWESISDGLSAGMINSDLMGMVALAKWVEMVDGWEVKGFVVFVKLNIKFYRQK